MTGFMKNLVRIGMVMGMWLGILFVVTNDVGSACVAAGVTTVLTVGFVVWERVHRA